MGFTFGENWEKFVARNYSEERVEAAKTRLLSSLQRNDLKGMSFLDIGLGSGIHSLAAYKAGAERIVSFDIDDNCVRVGRELAAKVGSPENWVLVQGSVLDDEFMESLGKFDIVYSWGVLSFTEDIPKAVENSAKAMNDNATLFIALYSYYAYFLGALWRKNKFGGGIFPEEWKKIKAKYRNASSILVKKWFEIKYIYNYCLIPPRYTYSSLKNFYDRVVKYKGKRGMAFMTDVRDWLGGWPMDFVKDDEFNKYNYEKLNLELICMDTGEGLTDFFYKKKEQENYLDKIMKKNFRLELVNLFSDFKKKTRKIDLKEYLKEFDFAASPKHAIRMYRGGKELYKFTGGIDGVLASTIECYNVIDGVLFYNHGENAEQNDHELYIKYQL